MVEGDVLVVLLRTINEAFFAFVVKNNLALVGSVTDFFNVFGIEISDLLLDLLSLLGSNFNGFLFGTDLFLDQFKLFLEISDLVKRKLLFGTRFGGFSRPPC